MLLYTVKIKVLSTNRTAHTEHPYWLEISKEEGQYEIKVREEDNTIKELYFKSISQVKIIFSHFIHKYRKSDSWFKADISYCNSLFNLSDNSLVEKHYVSVSSTDDFKNRIMNNLDEIDTLTQ